MQVKTSRQLFLVLDQERKSTDRSDRSLSIATRVSTATIGQIRKRKGNMHTDTMFAIARELGFKVWIEK